MKNFHVASLSLGIVFMLFAGMVASQPIDKFPEQFYGTVTINGAPAADGVLVSVKFEGKDVGGTPTPGGNYNIIISMKESDEGEAISFYVQNVNTGIQSIFQGGNSVQLDLSATIAAPPASGGGSSGGGGGSSGGGSGGSGVCTESWICTDWTDCSNYVQKRVCADVNQCNTTASKPVESQECTMPVVCEAGSTKCENGIMSTCSGLGTTWLQSQICEAGCEGNVCKQAQAGLEGSGTASAFTGLFLFEQSAWPYWIVLIVVIIVILGWYFLGRGKKK